MILPIVHSLFRPSHQPALPTAFFRTIQALGRRFCTTTDDEFGFGISCPASPAEDTNFWMEHYKRLTTDYPSFQEQLRDGRSASIFAYLRRLKANGEDIGHPGVFISKMKQIFLNGKPNARKEHVRQPDDKFWHDHYVGLIAADPSVEECSTEDFKRRILVYYDSLKAGDTCTPCKTVLLRELQAIFKQKHPEKFRYAQKQLHQHNQIMERLKELTLNEAAAVYTAEIRRALRVETTNIVVTEGDMEGWRKRYTLKRKDSRKDGDLQQWLDSL